MARTNPAHALVARLQRHVAALEAMVHAQSEMLSHLADHPFCSLCGKAVETFESPDMDSVFAFVSDVQQHPSAHVLKVTGRTVRYHR